MRGEWYGQRTTRLLRLALTGNCFLTPLWFIGAAWVIVPIGKAVLIMAVSYPTRQGRSGQNLPEQSPCIPVLLGRYWEFLDPVFNNPL